MIKKILAPLDGSTLAEQALPYVECLATAFKAEIILLWVLHPLYITSEHGLAIYDTLLSQERQEAESYLKQLQAHFTQQHIPAKTVILKSQPIADAIVDLAAKEKVDVIVKTTHGRSGLSRWVYGSVATKVLQYATCPVFLIKAKADSKVDQP